MMLRVTCDKPNMGLRLLTYTLWWGLRETGYRYRSHFTSLSLYSFFRLILLILLIPILIRVRDGLFKKRLLRNYMTKLRNRPTIRVYIRVNDGVNI